MILGIDIGGANTKAASSDGRFAYSKYLPLWRGCDIAGTLRDVRQAAGPVDAVGVTITGELADCFASKREGVEHIAAEASKAFPGAVFYGSDGAFHGDAREYRLLAASNWSASARHVGRVHRDVLLVDAGSTTTDVIPVVDGVPAAGPTDFERLARGELLYTGALRTNVAALLQKVRLRGRDVRTASELFAITADANLLLGRIGEADYACDTPDGAAKTREAAALRLARVVCCDLEELSIGEAAEIAGQAYRRQVEALEECIDGVASRHGLRRAAVCGLGDFIAGDALDGLGIVHARAGPGRDISRVYPAYAVARLLEEEQKC